MTDTDLPQAPKEGAWPPGAWKRWLAYTPEPEFRPYWTATIKCQKCSRKLNLSQHKIDVTGQVSPSVGHPVEYPPCDWHPTPRLIGWEDWPAPPTPALSTCERCGKQSHTVGGWGTWSGGTGIICDKCIKERRG